MPGPRIRFSDNDMTINLDREYVLEQYHINNVLRDMFRHSYIPPYVKKKTVLFIGEAVKEQISDNMFTVGFLNPDSGNKDIINTFNEMDYRIIMGFEENLSNIVQLEMFFSHRTDMVVLLNSDNIQLADEIRGTFNAPVYMADFHTYSQIAYKTANGLYRLNSELDYRQEEGNLYSAGKDKKRYFIINSADEKEIILDDIFYYSKNQLLKFMRNDKTPFYIAPFTMEQMVKNADRHILKFSCSIEENSLQCSIFMYGGEFADQVKEKTASMIEEFMQCNNIRSMQTNINIKVF